MARARKNGKPSSRPPARPSGMFKPHERMIYKFWDGRKDRLGDPLEIVRRLTTRDGFDLAIDSKLAVGSTPETPKALGRVVEAVRDVFGVESLADGGLTDGEVLALLVHFMTYVAEVQKDLAPLPTWPGVTDCPAANGSTTDHSSASGSTGTVP